MKKNQVSSICDFVFYLSKIKNFENIVDFINSEFIELSNYTTSDINKIHHSLVFLNNKILLNFGESFIKDSSDIEKYISAKHIQFIKNNNTDEIYQQNELSNNLSIYVNKNINIKKSDNGDIKFENNALTDLLYSVLKDNDFQYIKKYCLDFTKKILDLSEIWFCQVYYRQMAIDINKVYTITGKNVFDNCLARKINLSSMKLVFQNSVLEFYVNFDLFEKGIDEYLSNVYITRDENNAINAMYLIFKYGTIVISDLLYYWPACLLEEILKILNKKNLITNDILLEISLSRE